MPENKNNPVYAKILSIFLHKKKFFDLNFFFFDWKISTFFNKGYNQSQSCPGTTCIVAKFRNF